MCWLLKFNIVQYFSSIIVLVFGDVTLTGTSGAVSSPFYGIPEEIANSYLKELFQEYTTWNIMVHQDQIIEITFKEFEISYLIPNHDFCVNFFMVS